MYRTGYGVGGMTLEEFAKDAGVTIVDCGPGWNGRIGFQMADSPNTTICGFRTESAAYKHWLKYAFGDGPARAVTKLLNKNKTGGKP